MKKQINQALKITALSIIVCCILYSLLILIIAQAAPNKGEGQTLIVNGEVRGYLYEGQSFTQDKYFNGRPSAVSYNAASSSGSNKGPTNPDYLKDVQARVDSFLVHNPGKHKSEIPSELVTASGSGLDPDVSILGAMIQVDRIAKSRNLSSETINKLIIQQKERPFLGLFGTEKVNVLKLNIALNEIK
jgi:K+-transporting ATPase ATPase C chain